MLNWGEAYIPDEKLTGYLLSETHAVGKWKADFFKTLGFTENHAIVLEERLLEVARAHDATRDIQTDFGTKLPYRR